MKKLLSPACLAFRHALWQLGGGLVWLCLLSGCAQLMGPQTVSWSEADLNQMLARRFPLDRRLLDLLDVKVSQPHVQLLGERNRLATELSVEATDRLFATRYQGRIALESGLRYEPSDQTLRLSEVRVTAFNLDTAGARTPQMAQKLGAAMAEGMLNDAVIHRLSPEQLARLSQKGYRPGSVQISARGLELTVVPLP